MPDKTTVDHQPYVKHTCYGRYMELGRPWTEKLSTCAEHCDLRFKCHQDTKAKKEKTDDAA